MKGKTFKDACGYFRVHYGFSAFVLLRERN